MGRTPDRTPGRRSEESILFEDDGLAPTDVGELKFQNGRFQLKDADGILDPRSASGVTETAHQTLRQLIHFLEDGVAPGFATSPYRETLPASSPFPTSVTWWTSSAKTAKIVEKVLTRDGSQRPTVIVWRLYAVDGSTVLATATDTITWSGPFELSRTRAYT